MPGCDPDLGKFKVSQPPGVFLQPVLLRRSARRLWAMKRAVEALGSTQTPVGAHSRKGPTAGKGPTTRKGPTAPHGANFGRAGGVELGAA